MTSGERRLAERLQQKLDDNFVLWYDVPVGPIASGDSSNVAVRALGLPA